MAGHTEQPLRDYVATRARSRHPLNVNFRFQLWVLAHYGTATSQEAIKLAWPKLRDAQREDGTWQFDPDTGGGAGGQMSTIVFRNHFCTTYRILEALHLGGLLPDLVASGQLKADPFPIFQRRNAIVAIVARRDFEGRPAKRDASLTERWTEAVLADQSPDGSWSGSVVLTAHALHLLADLQVRVGGEVKSGLEWLRHQFRPDVPMPPYDRRSRLSRPLMPTFGAATDPMDELDAWTRITATGGQGAFQACWQRIGGAQSALAVWALNRWGQGRSRQARQWVEQTALLGHVCGNFASRVFVLIRHRAGEIDLTPRELDNANDPEVVAAAERLLQARPDLPRAT